MSGFTLTVTNAGRAALVNAANNGTAPVVLAAVGVSATAVTPTPSATTLPGEIKRITTLSGDAVAADTIHVTIRDESADVYTVRSLALYLADGTLFALYGQAQPIMEKSAQAMLLLAVDVIFADIDAQQIAFGDTNFLLPPATTERPGQVELATTDETTNGADATRAVTPKGLKTAVTTWLDSRFGAGAPSTFVKGLLTSASAAALRLALGLKSAALKDEGSGKGLDADLLDGQHGSYYANIVARLGYTPWGPNNDGAGSGLDADLLDGKDSSAFAPAAHSHDYLPATSLGSYASYAVDKLRGGYHGLMLGNATAASVVMFTPEGLGGIYAQGVGWRLYFDGTDFHIGGTSGRKVWNAANDGAGSGLDADLLDGAQAHQFMRSDQTAETFGIYRVAGISDLNAVPRGDYRALIPFHSNYQAANRPGLNYFGGIDMSGGLSGYRWQFGMAVPSVSPQFWGRQQSAGTWGNWVQFWHTDNDGAGSGLDADMLDGLHASAFARLSGADFTGAISVPLGSGYNIGGTSVLSKTSNGAAVYLVSGSGSFIVQNAARTANILTLANGGDLSVAGAITSGGNISIPDGAAYHSNGKPVLREAGGGTWLYAAGANGYTFRNAANTATILSISDAGAAAFAGAITRAGNKVWDAGNDGSGSGLDADLLDGQHASYYMPAGNYTAADVKAKMLTQDGSGSGLDADLLDGLHASDFAKLADFVASKTANGYCKLPGGMIIQAGRFTAANDSTVTVSFPIAFPNLCMGVVVSGTANLGADAQDNNPAVRSGSVLTTSFQVFNAADTTQAFFVAFGW